MVKHYIWDIEDVGSILINSTIKNTEVYPRTDNALKG
jgi:hypothetical protein